MKLVKTKAAKYFVTTAIVVLSFWFYFQIDTYPYKVARWFQPLEAGVVSVTTKHCSPANSWLNLFVEHAVHHQGAYSAQVVFLEPQRHLHACEIGYKDKLFGVPVSVEHRYRYASTTKLVTSITILKLVQQGKINLNDTLVSFFPELTRFKDGRVVGITIAHLLNHQAGFNRLTLNGDPMFLRQNKPWCPNNLKELQTIKLAFNPGERQVYSNLGFCLLGEVIHRVTGEGYRDYVDNKFSLAERNIKFVDNYYYDDEVRYDYRYEEWFSDSYLKLFDFNAIASSAGLSGSASALAGLLSDIHHVSPESPFIFKAPSINCNLQKALGCMSDGVFHYQPDQYGITLLFHAGYLPGSTSVAVIDNLGGVVVVLMSGATPQQISPQNEWVGWIYKRLNLYYTLQGKLPILNQLFDK